ncbi:cytochrome P450 [Pseudonocardia sulfidoxydans NBRC 16205]|uniref:Cytochrome P450 n=1 Tax=Pseudonocardia sulfidoxydans NBRC 16205 TaxID=1223511 RepID=A0A511DSZ5_9PSEU|nr:cytochrome P450 [Pseudonocardia sulfidoxydans]GEL26874.1 cytochrome P450 [Pseudonocardia sulfidoxydans NBRC 16205]
MSLTTNFDQYNYPVGPDFTPFDFIEDLRDEIHENNTPVFWSETYGGYWIVGGYPEAREIWLNTKTFSNLGITFPEWEMPDGRQLMLAGYDAPQHTKYRRLVQDTFSPTAAARMTDYFRKDANRLIDRFIDRGHANIATELAGAVPGRMAAMLCGLEPEKGDVYRTWTKAMTQGGPRGDANVEPLMRDFKNAFWEMLEDHRANPGDDVMSYLISSTIDDKPLTDEELMDFFAVILIGGIDNTAFLLSDICWRLAWDRELRRRLIKHPEILETTIDEFQRYYAQGGASRLIMEDVEIAGVQMKKGQHLFFCVPLINRDPREFENPDTFLPTRSPNRHLNLGVGTHRCIGAHLLRVEATVVVEELLRRIPDFELDLSQEPIWINGQTGGFDEVHVKFPPGGGYDQAIRTRQYCS